MIIPGIGIALLLFGLLIHQVVKSRRLASSCIESGDKMSGEDFEKFLLELFKRGASGDHFLSCIILWV